MAALVLVSAAAGADGATNIDPAHPHAYGANIGWVNARGDVANGAVIGAYYCTGSFYGANVGWIRLGSGTPANGYAYANNSASDWGVNHDGQGQLRGYAYGANIGWIHFEDNGDPRVDLQTGNLSGHAYGANVGWISLSNSVAFVRTETLDWGPDSDHDGIPDAYEYKRTGGLGALGPFPDDADGNGTPDIEEFYADTHPTVAASQLRVTDVEPGAGLHQITWTVEPTRLYRVEMANSVTNGSVWVDSGLGVMAPPAAPTMTRDVAHTNQVRFFRARALVPLAP